MNVLGIETSCDETSVAVIDGQGRVRSNVIASQMQAHAAYGGVVPEIAARAHLENLPAVFDQALETAGIAGDVRMRNFAKCLPRCTHPRLCHAGGGQ